MQLLISVAGPADARAALLGGADVIDAKDPRHGALGPVSPHRLAAIRAVVSRARPLSAALGDAADEKALMGGVAAAASLGVAFVKVGFAGITSEARARRLAVAAQRAATDGGTRVVVVAYADWRHAGSLAPARLVGLAAAAGAASPPPPARVPVGRGLLPERDVELPEIVRRYDEMLHAVRERA